MNMGRGLIRLYFAMWAIWFCFGVATNYKELATYLGSDRWTEAKAVERGQAKCNAEPESIDCFLITADEFVTDDLVNVVVWMFGMAMIKAPFYFLIFVTAVYWIGKWVSAGFRRKQ
jgi:hypothetical protein